MNKKITKGDVLNLISKSSIYGNLGLFIGAGMSMAILNDSHHRKIALSWSELIHKCAKILGVDLEKINLNGYSFPDIATEIAKIIAEKEGIDYKSALNKLKEKIAQITAWYPEKEKRLIFGNHILGLNPNWIITTNYDLIIESLLTGKCLSLGPDDQLIAPNGLIPIYHLHGTRTSPTSIIISQEDYISLFRPNQYRQTKLSLSIKESTTLIIGYGLGDMNVLTAVDWTKNVYSQQRINYPHEIIQLLFKPDPKEFPYKDRNDIIILEFSDLESILEEINETIAKDIIAKKGNEDDLDGIIELLVDPSNESVENFIDDETFRKSVLEHLNDNNTKLISCFLELFSRSMEETWKRARPTHAFYAYNENLIVNLDILLSIKLENMSPALLEAVAYNLERVSYYIGKRRGESIAAYGTWNKKKNELPKDTLYELKNIAELRNYYNLSQLLSELI